MNTFVIFVVALFCAMCLQVMASTMPKPPQPQGVSRSDLAKFRVEVGKSLGPINNNFMRLLVDAESGRGVQGEELRAALAAEYVSRAEKYGRTIYDLSVRINDVLGRIDEETDETKIKEGSVSSAVACPIVVDSLTKIINAIPFANTVDDKDEHLVKATQLTGYVVSHALTDYSCRRSFNLIDFIPIVDRVIKRFVSSIDPSSSPTAEDTVELWTDLRSSVATYITTVDDQTSDTPTGPLSLDGLNNPEQEAASLEMFQAAALADMLEIPAELNEVEVTFLDRVNKVSQLIKLKDEL